MKNSKTCPKCKSTDIIPIPGAVGPYGVGNNIETRGWPFRRAVTVTRYLCGSCGFSEEWVDSKDVEKLRKKFAR